MPSWEVRLSPRFLRLAKKLNAGERRKVQEAIDAAVQAWGNPHAHAGVGIRRLRSNAFECRWGLHLRLIFFAEASVLTFLTLGNHDEVQNFLKSN